MTIEGCLRTCSDPDNIQFGGKGLSAWLMTLTFYQMGRGRAGNRLAMLSMSPNTPAAVTSAPAPGPRTTSG